MKRTDASRAEACERWIKIMLIWLNRQNAQAVHALISHRQSLDLGSCPVPLSDRQLSLFAALEGAAISARP